MKNVEQNYRLTGYHWAPLELTRHLVTPPTQSGTFGYVLNDMLKADWLVTKRSTVFSFVM